MDMIRHHDPVQHVATLPVEMQQRLLDQRGYACILQAAASVASVEVRFQFSVILLRTRSSCGMDALLYLLRQGVSQSEGHELKLTRHVEVRQVPT